MLISAGKDCYMKFWHLMPDSKPPAKETEATPQSGRKDSSERGYKEWTGDQDDSDSQEEPASVSPKRPASPPPVEKKPPKKKTPPKSPPKKEPEPKSESSDDDDLTGWY